MLVTFSMLPQIFYHQTFDVGNRACDHERPRVRPWTLRGCPLKPCVQSGPLKFVNTLCHVSYTCLLVNVVKILFVGQTNFWCIFKNGRALSCLYFVDEMYIKAKTSTFFNMKAGNRFRQDSYMTLGWKVPYFFSKNKNVFFSCSGLFK